MHNLESFLENEIHKILWNFEIQTDQLISARRPGFIITNNKKETLQKCGPQNEQKGSEKETWSNTLPENWENVDY